MSVVIHKAELMLCVRVPGLKTEDFFSVFRNVFNLQSRNTARNIRGLLEKYLTVFFYANT